MTTTKQNISDDGIHLAISPWDLTDGYNQHASVTIASFLDNCYEESVTVHILYDGRLNCRNLKGAEDNIRKYATVCERFGSELLYHSVRVPDWVCELEGVKKFTPGALLRLYLPDLLPDVMKVIYLDCDVVVNTDIRQMWSLDIRNYPLAAVHDSGISEIPESELPDGYFRKLGTTRERYFNSGVLIMNLDYIRREGHFTEEAFQFIREIQDFPWIDQEVLNKFFGQQYLEMDSKYNIMVGRKEDTSVLPDGILHYAMSDAKPWKGYHGKLDIPYWRYLLQTPWGEF